jgi:serine/threonine protein kinase
MDKFNTNQQKSDKEKASVNDNSLKVTLSLQENGKKFSQESLKKMTISDFLLIKNLGKGSYGKVLMAKHALSNKCYAIKVIDKAFIEIEEKVHEVHIERIILTKFNHPNIIKLYYTFHNSKKLYFVLELAEKGDLKHFIKSASINQYN